MNVLICGGRDYTDETSIAAVVDGLDPSEDIVIHGGARGVDAIAGRLARRRGIHTAEVVALWTLFGPGAGPRRNQAMLHLAEKVIAFPGGKGTANCVKQARALGIPVERVESIGEER